MGASKHSPGGRAPAALLFFGVPVIVAAQQASPPADVVATQFNPIWHSLGLAGLAVLVTVLVIMNLRRRSVERRLAESEQKYRLLVEHQSDMVVQVDAENRFTFVNPRYCEVFGKTEEELIGRRFMPLVHPDDQESTLQAMRALLDAPHVCSVEQRAKTVDGWRWIAWSDRAIVGDDGAILSVIGVGQDITERKAAEERLQNALHEKDALMQEMNHRIKNNLMMIVSLIRLKARQTDGMSDLADILRQIEAIRIVHEKLHESADVGSVPMQPYLTELLSTVFESFTNHRVRSTVEATGVNLPSRCATVIGLIVNELATNAIKHGSVGTEPMEFSCTMTVHEDRYALVVANSGRPFPAEIDLATTTSLGTRIVTMLVEQLDGELELRREPSPRFTIRFPV